MQIILADIPINITKKNIKNLHLYVKPPTGKVEVSAPSGMSDTSIEMFLRTKLGWIRHQQDKFNNQARQTVREYISGETLYVWGKQYFLQVDFSNKGNSIKLDGNKAILTVRKESSAEQRDNYVNEWYRSLLKEQIRKLLPKWELKTGLNCSSWQTKYMTTRWGTCNVKTGKVWFNLQLAKKPTECLDYIILHELAHLKEKNHNEMFISILDEYMPYWRDIRKKLNDEILDYME